MCIFIKLDFALQSLIKEWTGDPEYERKLVKQRDTAVKDDRQ